MNIEELRSKTHLELNKLLHETLTQQFKLRMQNASGQLKTNHLLSQSRRNIARIKTIMREKVSNNVNG